MTASAIASRISLSAARATFEAAAATLSARSREAPSALDVPAAFARFTRDNAAALAALRDGVDRLVPGLRWHEGEATEAPDLARSAGGTYWVCDPIDGALHYLQGLPGWAMSLCLVEDGRPALAFVYDPIGRALFRAARGEGASEDGAPIRASTKLDLSAAVVCTTPPSRPAVEVARREALLAGLAAILPRVFAVRMLGASSLQLAWTASGRADAFWEAGDDPFDWLAGALLVEEAGGAARAPGGAPFGLGGGGILAGGSSIVAQLGPHLAPSAS